MPTSRRIKFLRPKASNGLNALIAGLKEREYNVKKIKISSSRYSGGSTDLIFNWGRGNRAAISDALPILNPPEAVLLASAKIETFRTLQAAGMENNLPKWTTDYGEARSLIEDECEKIYCRTLTRASEGRGIVIASDPADLVDAPLYTAAVDVDREVRVHVFNGKVIDFAQKKRMGSERLETEGLEEPDEEIRSHARGWVFARGGVEISEEVKQVAIDGVSALGLDFGAVDIAITPQGIAKIYEINTAPGLEGTTLENYINAFTDYIEEQ